MNRTTDVATVADCGDGGGRRVHGGRHLPDRRSRGHRVGPGRRLPPTDPHRQHPDDRRGAPADGLRLLRGQHAAAGDGAAADHAAARHDTASRTPTHADGHDAAVGVDAAGRRAGDDLPPVTRPLPTPTPIGGRPTCADHHRSGDPGHRDLPVDGTERVERSPPRHRSSHAPGLRRARRPDRTPSAAIAPTGTWPRPGRRSPIRSHG